MPNHNQFALESPPSTPLLEQLLKRGSRERALEAALIAHVLLDDSVLNDRGRFTLSPESAFLLDVITEMPGAARASLAAAVGIDLRLENSLGIRSAQFCDDALALARRVEAITIGELASVGRLASVIALLDSVHEDVRRERQHLGRAA